MSIRFTGFNLEGRSIAAALTSLALALVASLCSGTKSASAQAGPASTQAPLAYPRPAGTFQVPDFPPGLPWFNVDHPLSMKALRGKMVLLDFWTYG